jgi:DNA-directed RNA polymerase subunit RPC12/RpoP
MLAVQDNKCAICGKEDDTVLSSGAYKRLAVDHCHKTGKLRGILCENCNRGIGMFKDNQELLEQAIRYLNQF